MQFGIHLPDSGHVATRESMIEIATLADRLRFDSVFSSDHIAWPDPATLRSKYPYNDSGDFIPIDTPWIDCLGSLLFVAGCTEHVQLGTTVAILGYRPVVQQAKLWASLDHLSGGRAILGVGVGWMLEEFEALGRPHDQRGKRADEFLEIFEVLWREPRPHFDGPFTQFGPVGFEPKPPRGRIPVWVGGHSPPAYRRAARFGDAWHVAFATPESTTVQWDGVRKACEAIDRDPRELELTALLGIDFDRAPTTAGWVGGSDAAIVDALSVYRDLGVSHLVCWFVGRSERRVESIERFHSEIRPAL